MYLVLSCCWIGLLSLISLTWHGNISCLCHSLGLSCANGGGPTRPFSLLVWAAKSTGCVGCFCTGRKAHDPEVESYLVTVLKTSDQKERIFYQLIAEVLIQHQEQDSFLGSWHKPAGHLLLMHLYVYLLTYVEYISADPSPLSRGRRKGMRRRRVGLGLAGGWRFAYSF